MTEKPYVPNPKDFEPKGKTKILITGGCGFAGHHLVEHLLKHSDWEIYIIDKLNYAAQGFDRLHEIDAFDDNRVRIFTVDFTQPISVGVAKEIGDVSYLVHMGAETHVDNSIEDPELFVKANVLGTLHILQFARNIKGLKKFLYFSTDEVFGPAPEGVAYKEWDRYNSGNPYAAAKAGGEELALAFGNTYKLPVIVTHTMNLFGERQHPEKFIPMVIGKVLKGEKVTIHANHDKTQAGSRFYIHCRNMAKAVHWLLKHGETQDKYNIVGEKEVDNLQLAQFIAKTLGKKLKYEMVDFHSSRPGHDLRYALDGTKLKDMGFSFDKTFEDSLRKTIEWTVAHKEQWLK